MSDFKGRYESGVATLRRDKLFGMLYDRIYRPLTSCRERAPRHLVDVLVNGITIAFFQENVHDRFDQVKFELCFEGLETDTKPSSILQTVWKAQDRSSNSTPGIVSAVLSHTFRLFDDDSVAMLFDGVFMLMHDLLNDYHVDFYGEEQTLEFCDVADSLTLAVADEEQDTK